MYSVCTSSRISYRDSADQFDSTVKSIYLMVHKSTVVVGLLAASYPWW